MTSPPATPAAEQMQPPTPSGRSRMTRRLELLTTRKPFLCPADPRAHAELPHPGSACFRHRARAKEEGEDLRRVFGGA